MNITNRLENRPEKYWIMCYLDGDKKTFNPGLVFSDWATMREVEKITISLQKEGRKVKVCTTPTVYNIHDLLSQGECVTAGPQGYSYDPFLIW